MQHKYFGDIGDFGKYGLLKYLASKSRYKLAINWCLHPPEDKKDGRHVDYIDNDKLQLRSCDEEIFDTLEKLIDKWRTNKCESSRHLGLVREKRIIGNDFIENMEVPQEKGNKKERLQAYEDWHKEGLSALSDSELVFFDPDNGIEVKSYPMGSTKGSKYVFIEHLKDYFDEGKSLIIYQHRDRSKDCYKKKLQKLREEFSTADIFYIIFTRVSQRAYFFVLQDHHKKIREIIHDEFLNSEWRRCFRKEN